MKKLSWTTWFYIWVGVYSAIALATSAAAAWFFGKSPYEYYAQFGYNEVQARALIKLGDMPPLIYQPWLIFGLCIFAWLGVGYLILLWLKQRL